MVGREIEGPVTTDDRTGGRRRALDSEGRGTMPEVHETSAPGDSLPWGFILDPEANRRALGDVQERGLRAARDLADRVISSIGATERPPTGDHRKGAIPSDAPPNDPIVDLLRAWSEVGARVLAELTAASPSQPDHAGSDAPAGGMAVDVNDQGPPTTWRLRVNRRGLLLASAELWLCNPQSHPVGPLCLGLDDLRRSTGTVVSSDLLRLDPSTVELPARCARAVAVTLSADDPLEPGVYRGMLQADGAPEFGVIVELTVEDPGR
jgi:hypothetical protein